MTWFNEPGQWGVPMDAEPEKEGAGGSWSIFDDGLSLELRPDSKKDFWRRTYYNPIIVKDDGPCLLRTVPADMLLTMEVYFTLTPYRQFDQAGLIVRFDKEHWLKTGIEVVDGIPRLSCVVTNTFSDWSTTPWKDLSLRIRITQKGDGSYVVEANVNPGFDLSKQEIGF